MTSIDLSGNRIEYSWYDMLTLFEMRAHSVLWITSVDNIEQSIYSSCKAKRGHICFGSVKMTEVNHNMLAKSSGQDNR